MDDNIKNKYLKGLFDSLFGPKMIIDRGDEWKSYSHGVIILQNFSTARRDKLIFPHLFNLKLTYVNNK